MKVITTNLLNRFWVIGVKPIQTAVAKKLDAAKIANNRTTTASGYALDARQGKALQDEIDELNSNSIIEAGDNYIKYANGLLEQWGEASSTKVDESTYATVEFPIAFVNTDYCIQATPKYYNTTYIAFNCSVQKSTGNRAIIYTRTNSGGALYGVSIYWRAIGRWK